MEMKRAMITIIGLVQGVGFRHHARGQAQRLGLVGYVKNRPDGGVECCVEGDEIALEGFIAWCKQGPTLAHIESVGVEPGRYVQEFQRFEIR